MVFAAHAFAHVVKERNGRMGKSLCHKMPQEQNQTVSQKVE
jgi:hypothetical protein